MGIAVNYQKLHDWPADRAQALEIQQQLAPRVVSSRSPEPPGLIAACETSYGVEGRFLYAAAVVMTFPDLEEIERSYFVAPVQFAYFPGLLYFREGPAITGALVKLTTNPDLLILNGHGIAHPRRCGMASLLGVTFDIVTIGCARQLLAGHHYPVGESRGSYQPIRLSGQEVGCAYRSKDKVKPLFISPGHRCDLAYAREMIVKCLRGFRLPEPLRVAHLLANKARQRAERDQGRPSDIESV